MPRSDEPLGDVDGNFESGHVSMTVMPGSSFSHSPRAAARLSIFGLGSVAIASLILACRKDPPVDTTADAALDASAASAASAASDGGNAAPRKDLAAFTSKEDMDAYFKSLVEADATAKARRLALIEAGVEAGALWGTEIGDSFGSGGLGLSGIGEGGGGTGQGIGLGNIGTIGSGSGTGTGQGYGAGSGRFSAVSKPARAPAAAGAPSITNTQVEGVDEGDIVKTVGDFLVVLRRGRLFTVKIAGGALTPVSHVDAFGPDLDPKGTWYDEMLVSKTTVVIIGYSYARGGTELGLFDIDDKGALKYRATYHLRGADYYSSRNYASRLVGDKLVFYSPSFVSASEADPTKRFPAIRKWKPGVDASAFASVIEPTRIYKQLVPGLHMTLHAVTVCNVSEPALSCTSRGVLGPAGRVFYVSQAAVYVWTTPYTRYVAPPKIDAGAADGGADASKPVVPSQSYVYRLPLDGSEPTVLRASGAPIDQFSFHEADGHLDVLVRESGNGDAMWAAEGATKNVALLRVPLTSFTSAAEIAPSDAYTALPSVGGFALQNRFVGDYVLYGTGSGWSRARDKAETKVTAYRYASRNAAQVQVLPLDHVVDRIEPIGDDALVVGGRDKDLVMSAISLGATAEPRGRYVRKNASQGETRSHGFFYRRDSDSQGVFGLPLRGGDEAGANQLVAGSASIVFVKNDALAFREVGSIAAKTGAATNDGCRASCVDWYGNARPIFLGDRVIALMGYELVDATVENGELREKKRASFAPGQAK